MFNWKDFEQTKDILSHAGKNYTDSFGQHHVKTRPRDLVRWVEFLKEDLGYLTLVDIVGVDHQARAPFRFEVLYQFLNMGTHQRINLHVPVSTVEIVPGISDYFPHAEWMEREVSEMLGVRFSKFQANLLLPAGETSYPLRKDASLGSWKREPQHPLPQVRYNPNKSEAPYPEESWSWKKYSALDPETLGNFEWHVCFDPNRIVNSKVYPGLHHQGWEKFLESKNWLHVLQLVDKLNLGAAPTYSVAWAKTLEEILRIKLPERAQALRIVLLELARIVDHLTVLGEITHALQKEEYRLFIDAREKVYELLERFTGHRQAFGVICLGGLKEDLPHGWIIEYQKVAEILTRTLTIINNSLILQPDFREALSVSPVDAQTILKWGVSGPTMRASGLNFDLRKSQPFYFYQDIDFDIPVGIYGTPYDRYLIRFEEIYQSFRIITQVIDNLPLGEIVASELSVFNPQSGIQPLPIPEDWHYSCLESPNGEVGFFHLTTDGLYPYRIKIKAPSFTLTQALPDFTLGLQEPQIKPALASLGLRRMETDR